MHVKIAVPQNKMTDFANQNAFKAKRLILQIKNAFKANQTGAAANPICRILMISTSAKLILNDGGSKQKSKIYPFETMIY